MIGSGMANCLQLAQPSRRQTHHSGGAKHQPFVVLPIFRPDANLDIDKRKWAKVHVQ